MKQKLYPFLLVLVSVSISKTSVAQGLAVNTTGAVADASAILDVSSATKGMLPPRMTAAQIAAISNPATGLVAYQTDGTKGLYINNGTPSSPNWQRLAPATSPLVQASAWSSYPQGSPLQKRNQSEYVAPATRRVEQGAFDAPNLLPTTGAMTPRKNPVHPEIH